MTLPPVEPSSTPHPVNNTPIRIYHLKTSNSEPQPQPSLQIVRFYTSNHLQSNFPWASCFPSGSSRLPRARSCTNLVLKETSFCWTASISQPCRADSDAFPFQGIATVSRNQNHMHAPSTPSSTYQLPTPIYRFFLSSMRWWFHLQNGSPSLPWNYLSIQCSRSPPSVVLQHPFILFISLCIINLGVATISFCVLHFVNMLHEGSSPPTDFLPSTIIIPITELLLSCNPLRS